MTFDQWFEERYPKQRYPGYDPELSVMREEYRVVWDAAVDAAAKLFEGYNYGPFVNPGITIRGMKRTNAAVVLAKKADVNEK